MDSIKLWYGGKRGTILHLLNIGATVQHLDANTILVDGLRPGQLKHLRNVMAIERPRTSVEAAMVNALKAKGKAQ